MQITLQNTEKGQCYAVRFDRYRQQVVDKVGQVYRNVDDPGQQ